MKILLIMIILTIISCNNGNLGNIGQFVGTYKAKDGHGLGEMEVYNDGYVYIININQRINGKLKFVEKNTYSIDGVKLKFSSHDCYLTGIKYGDRRFFKQ